MLSKKIIPPFWWLRTMNDYFSSTTQSSDHWGIFYLWTYQPEREVQERKAGKDRARKGQFSASPSHHECESCQYHLHFIGQNLLYIPNLTVGKTMKHTEACGYSMRMSTLRHIAFIVTPFVTEGSDI